MALESYRMIGGLKVPTGTSELPIPSSSITNPLGNNTVNPVKTPLTNPTTSIAGQIPLNSPTNTNVAPTVPNVSTGLKTLGITTPTATPKVPTTGTLGNYLQSSGIAGGVNQSNSYTAEIANLYKKNLDNQGQNAQAQLDLTQQVGQNVTDTATKSADTLTKIEDQKLKQGVELATKTRDDKIKTLESQITNQATVNKKTEQNTQSLLLKLGGRDQLYSMETMTELMQSGLKSLNELTAQKSVYATDYETTVNNLYTNHSLEIEKINNQLNSTIAQQGQATLSTVNAIFAQYGKDSLEAVKGAESAAGKLADNIDKAMSLAITGVKNQNDQIAQAKEYALKQDQLAYTKQQTLIENAQKEKQLAMQQSETNTSNAYKNQQITQMQQDIANKKLLADPSNIDIYANAIMSGKLNASGLDESIKAKVLSRVGELEPSAELQGQISSAISGIPAQLRNSEKEKATYTGIAKQKLAEGYDVNQTALYIAGYNVDRKTANGKGVVLGDNIINAIKGLSGDYLKQDISFLPTLSNYINTGKYDQATSYAERKFEEYNTAKNKAEGSSIPNKVGYQSGLNYFSQVKSKIDTFTSKYNNGNDLLSSKTESFQNLAGITTQQSKDLTEIKTLLNQYSAQQIKNLYGGNVTNGEENRANMIFGTGDESFQSALIKMSSQLKTQGELFNITRQSAGFPEISVNSYGFLNAKEIGNINNSLTEKYIY